MSEPEPVTVAQYLNDHGVRVIPSSRVDADRAGFAVASPAGWDSAPDGQFPGATHVLIEPNLVEAGFAPNAVLLVGSLATAVDADELLACAYTDARVLPGWHEVEESAAHWLGAPSRYVKGTFTAEQWTLAVSTRYVVHSAASAQWLVQLTVTTLADQVDKLAFDIATINDSLTLGGRGTD